MSLRKILFWLHLTAGAVAGAVILVMCVTGVLLTYERQMTDWADGYALRPAPGAARIGVEALLAKAREAKGGWPTTITVRADPAAPAALAFGREGTLFLDPYTGTILGEGSKRAREFFHVVTDWHRWLNAHGDGRPAFRAVTGASNLAFLFIVLSGIYLWWPKQWAGQVVRPVVLFQGGLKGKARDFNWHNVIGIWSAVPLAFVVASSVPISYPWAQDLVHRLAGSVPPPRRPTGPPGAPGAAPARPSGPPADLALAGLDGLWARAEGRVPGWRSLSLRLPAANDAPFVFTIDTSSGARRPDTRSQLTLARTGEVVKYEGYEALSRGRKVLGWTRFIHTGEAFGLPGQTVAGLVSAGGAVLVYTGLSLALRRLAAWRRRRAAATAPRGEPEAAAG